MRHEQRFDSGPGNTLFEQFVRQFSNCIRWLRCSSVRFLLDQPSLTIRVRLIHRSIRILLFHLENLSVIKLHFRTVYEPNKNAMSKVMAFECFQICLIMDEINSMMLHADACTCESFPVCIRCCTENRFIWGHRFHIHLRTNECRNETSSRITLHFESARSVTNFPKIYKISEILH